MSPHDPDERGDDEWGAGFAAVTGALWLLAHCSPAEPCYRAAPSTEETAMQPKLPRVRLPASVIAAAVHARPVQRQGDG